MIHFFKDFIYSFLERRREGEREGEKHQCVVASHVPPAGDLACNPSLCPRLGIELVTLSFTGRHSIRWGTPARAKWFIFNIINITQSNNEQVFYFDTMFVSFKMLHRRKNSPFIILLNTVQVQFFLYCVFILT